MSPSLTHLLKLAAPVLAIATFGGLGSTAHARTCATTRLATVVEGEVWQGFGEVNPAFSSGQPLVSRGVVYMTRSGAAVFAPADGLVEYAGPVAAMGQVVIINIGHDNRVVLTGLSRLAVTNGQTVRSHAPVGAMPRDSKAPAHLYMELRCGEEAVNPIPTTVAMQ